MRNKRLTVIVLGFVGFSLLAYMFSNAVMFKREYERQSLDQLRELGQMVKNEIEYALGFGVPITSLGGMDSFLGAIVENTPDLAVIQVMSGNRIIFGSGSAPQGGEQIILPIRAGGKKEAQIRLGLSREMDKRTFAMLFDLITIVIAGLIITYEIIRFFSSKLVVVPFQNSLSAINGMIRDLNPHQPGAVPVELVPLMEKARRRIQVRRRQAMGIQSNMNQAAGLFLKRCFYGRQHFLSRLKQRRRMIDRLIRVKRGPVRVVDPSQIRPVVFLFFLGANLQASFLPLFSKELLSVPTFLSGLMSHEMLMAMPITCYMFTVFFVMLFMGSALFKRIIPMEHAIGIGVLFTAVGLVMGGVSADIVQLIASRMMSAVGFAFIVVYAKQFIVAHTRPENRAEHLAGFTAAFSGGLFCSVIIGSILVEYFSYRFAFFTAAAIVLLIFLFDYMILSDKIHAPGSGAGPVDRDSKSGLRAFFKAAASDSNLICIFIHGIFTRITFIGFFYYSVPVFLKPDFAFGDIGRIMMFYSIPSVLFGAWLNRRIKKAGQSKASVVGSNVGVGVVLMLFYFFASGPVWARAAYVIACLLVLGVSNSITFPAQSSLLVNTQTARTLGTRTALSVYSSFERIGSSLGPVFFGFFNAQFNITVAIVAGGVLCIAGNLIFLCFFNAAAPEAANDPS